MDSQPPSKELLASIVRELLDSLPASRDWFNPDAERVLREYLSDAKAHGQGTGSPPVPDDIERRARARFLENHGLPARDPWEHAPSATRHEYLEWARNNTPTKGGE